MPVRALLLTLGVGAFVCVTAGCGGGNSPAVAQVGTTTTSTSSTSATSAGCSGGSASAASSGCHAEYLACLEKHGVVISSSGSIENGGSIGAPSPTLQKAEAACQKFHPSAPPLSPRQEAVENTELLALAACMRTHGYPSFPDPTGQSVFDLPAAYGSVQNSPQFEAAMNTCQPHNPSVPLDIKMHTPPSS